MPCRSSNRRGERSASYSGPNMDFYNMALANTSLPSEWEKDQEGVWRRGSAGSGTILTSSATSGTNLSALVSPFEAPDGFNELAICEDTEATSVSSVAAEHDRHRSSCPETDTTVSPGRTPSPPPISTSDAIVGIGSVVSHEPQARHRLRPLEETNDDFEAQFVDHRRGLAVERIQACEAGHNPETPPNHLSVSTHDELCRSNGPERINEERVAICGSINQIPHDVDEACTTCFRLPDLYEVLGTRSVTQESGVAARDAEDRHEWRRGV